MTTSPVARKKRRRPLRRLLSITSVLVISALVTFIAAPLAWWAITAPEYDGYNYHTYRLIDSNRNFIEAGTPFPDDVYVFLPDGTPVPVNTLWQDKPLVIETASNSCPIYWESEVSMASLAERAQRGSKHNRALYPRSAPGYACSCSPQL